MATRDLLAAIAIVPGAGVVTGAAIGVEGHEKPRVGGPRTAQRQRWAGWAALLRAGRMAFLRIRGE